MNDIPRIIARVHEAIWAATPAVAPSVFDAIHARFRGSPKAAIAFAESTAPKSPTLSNGVAVIPVHGIIGKRLSALETECGGCDVDAIAAAIDAAAAADDVQGIVLDIASPGGIVTGVPELAEKIRGVTEKKPVLAFSSEQMCSAAYWIGAAADAIFCTPSAVVGSIGVYVARIDDSEWFKREGYKLDLIKAGEHKADGISGSSLSDAGRALIQADVDSIYGMFTSDVRKGRPGVSNASMQGQVFRGDKAAVAGLVDGVLPDLAALLADDLSALMTKTTISAMHSKPQSHTAADPDAALYDRYSALTGSARHQFFSANREALVREHTRRANALTPAQTDVLAKYQALTGAARQEFYRANEGALWAAYKRQRRAA
jgi:signal peptide peptidase SppA